MVLDDKLVGSWYNETTSFREEDSSTLTSTIEWKDSAYELAETKGWNRFIRAQIDCLWTKKITLSQTQTRKE